MKKLVKKNVQVERTPLHGQESISYWEEVEEELDDRDVENSVLLPHTDDENI